MEIIEVTSKEFMSIYHNPYHVFISAPFAELNSIKFDVLHYLVFKNTKTRLGIILAEKNNELYSPVSAPFGGFIYTKPNIYIDNIELAVSLLTDFGMQQSKSIEITLPPLFYSPDFLTKCINVFHRSAFTLKHIDLNYQQYITPTQNYLDTVKRKTKTNIILSSDLPFHFFKAETLTDIKRAYHIIKINHEKKGYPLRMTLDNVLDTIKIIPAEFFILELSGKDVAAAQAFHVADGVVQIIYWGDVPGYSESKPMNQLAYRIYEYYKDRGINIIDLGPSTENGIPNYGLCEFKEKIGCSLSQKHKYKLMVENTGKQLDIINGDNKKFAQH